MESHRGREQTPAMPTREEVQELLTKLHDVRFVLKAIEELDGRLSRIEGRLYAMADTLDELAEKRR